MYSQKVKIFSWRQVLLRKCKHELWNSVYRITDIKNFFSTILVYIAILGEEEINPKYTFQRGSPVINQHLISEPGFVLIINSKWDSKLSFDTNLLFILENNLEV